MNIHPAKTQRMGAVGMPPSPCCFPCSISSNHGSKRYILGSSLPTISPHIPFNFSSVSCSIQMS